MRLSFLFRAAFRALGRNKLRSALTMLGVVIGVASVVAMVAIGQGATASVKSSVSRMGNNILYITPGSSVTEGVRGGSGTAVTLLPDDGEAIAKECEYVTATSPVYRGRSSVLFEDRNWLPESIEGVSDEYAHVMEWYEKEGRWFNEQEVRAGAKVCMIGETVARELFGDGSPVDQTIRIAGTPVQVVGLLERRGSNAFGRDQDDTVIVPWTTYRRYLGPRWLRNVDRLVVSVLSASVIPQAQQSITRLLRERHKLRHDQLDDFTIRDLSQIADVFSETSRVMTTLLAAIASISLLVGGIGIMNIMLVSVSERTREIGIRMAVGARGKDILRQFLVESIVLALFGGIIGILLGVGASKAVSQFARWPTLISPESMVVAIAFSTLVGIIFGYYPAWRASRLDPIECLRYE